MCAPTLSELPRTDPKLKASYQQRLEAQMLSFKDIKEMDKVIKQRKRPSSQLKVNKENNDTKSVNLLNLNANDLQALIQAEVPRAAASSAEPPAGPAGRARLLLVLLCRVLLLMLS